MNEIAIRPEQGAELATYRASNLDRLEAWARQAVAVREIAAGIVNTSFVPKAYRGKPDEATAAILAGAELGFDPMASLRAFDDIQGTPAPKAITQRAVVQSKGHEVVVVEESATRAIVKGRRKGDTEWQTSEWTIERATVAGYVSKNPNYKSKPAEMLVARATSEVCRWIASDAIMGMPYSAEEISDHTGATAQPVSTRVTAADIVRMAVEHAPPDDSDAITDQQVQDIREPLTDRGVVDEYAVLAGISRIVGRDVPDIRDLTRTEAEQVISSLTGGAQ